MNSPIIVTGVGRTGTTSTAKILRDLGVFMGWKFLEDRPNDAGMEDIDFHTILLRHTSGRISRALFHDHLRFYANIRTDHWDSWGVKDPLISYYIRDFRICIPNAIFIICTRDREETIPSLMKCYKLTKGEAENFHDGRVRSIVKGSIDAHQLILHLDSHRDGTAEEKIKEFIQGGTRSNLVVGLLQKPGPSPEGCYCKPGRCMAPRPEWCRDRAKAALKERE